jgi:hypothetical protein
MKGNNVMISLTSRGGNQVLVDANLVAYVESLGRTAKIVFSGGTELVVVDEEGNVADAIQAAKAGTA